MEVNVRVALVASAAPAAQGLSLVLVEFLELITILRIMTCGIYFDYLVLMFNRLIFADAGCTRT